MSTTAPLTVCTGCGGRMPRRAAYCPNCDVANLSAVAALGAPTPAPAPAPHAGTPLFTPIAPRATTTRTTQRRRPRWFLGTFWMVWAVISFVAGCNGLLLGFLFAAACTAYAIYLYRGGKYGFFFIVF